MVQWLSSREARELVQREGMKLSSEGLFYSALKNGFLRRNPDKIHWQYNHEKLKQWLLQKQQIPDAGWILISSAAKQFGLTKAKIYYAIKKKLIQHKAWSKLYVNQSEIRQFVHGVNTESNHG